MAGRSKKVGRESTYYIEWGYVKGRSFTLTFLALGTMLVFYRIGTNLGQLTFEEGSPWVQVSRIVAVAIAYYAIDWVLKIILTDVATIAKVTEYDLQHPDDEEATAVKREVGKIWRVAVAALAITTTISTVSNFFVSSDLSGESHIQNYQQQLKMRMAQDTLQRTQAMSMLGAAPEKEQAMIDKATLRGDRLLEDAIAKGSPSWQRDYQKHKNKPSAWFWTCQECPYEYRTYREEIKETVAKRRRIISEASGYTATLTAALSPTLSGSMMQDSSLIEFKANALILEKERKRKESILTWVLTIMTFAGAIITLLLTWLLRKHREEHGQQVTDNPTRFLMIADDISNRVRRIISDVIYSVTFYQYEKMVRNGKLKSYTVEEESVIDDLHATVHNVKRCLNCDKELVGKRSDAKYCDDSCRTHYNNERRKAA